MSGVSEYKWWQVSTNEGKGVQMKEVSTSEAKCVLVEVGACISWCIYSYGALYY